MVGRMLLGHAPAHGCDVVDELCRIAPAGQNFTKRGGTARGEVAIAGDHPRSCQRHMFPCPGVALLISAKALEAGGDRPGVPGRAKPHIDIVQFALARRRGDGRDQTLSQSREIVDRRQGLRPVGLQIVPLRTFELRRRVIDEDQVDVGADGDLAPAELAKRYGCQPAPRQEAMLTDEIRLHLRLQGGNGAGGPVGVGNAPQDLDANLELAVAGPASRDVENILEIVGKGELAIEVGGEFAARRGRRGKTPAQHRVQQDRIAAEMFGQARSTTHDLGDQVQKSRVGMEQGEQLHAPWKRMQEGIEPREGFVGL